MKQADSDIINLLEKIRVAETGGATPTGAAGGDLGGTYPNPSVSKVGGVTTAIDTDGTLAANSDAKLATQKATKTYADTKQAAGSYALTTNPLSQFAATTSAQLAGTLSDETGFTSGALAVFNISPTLKGNNATGPVVITNVNAQTTLSGGLGNLSIQITSVGGYAGFWFPGVDTSDMFFGRETGTDDIIVSSANQVVLEVARFKRSGGIFGTHGASGTATSCTGATIGTGSKNNAGTVTATTTGVSTVVLTFSVTAPTGWVVEVSNRTTANLTRQSASSTTTATFTGTTVTGDVLSYVAVPY